MRNWKMAAAITLTIIAGAFFVGRSSKTEREKDSTAETVANSAAVVKRGAEVGDLAPDFQLARLKGSVMSLDDLRGQPAVMALPQKSFFIHTGL